MRQLISDGVYRAIKSTMISNGVRQSMSVFAEKGCEYIINSLLNYILIALPSCFVLRRKKRSFPSFKSHDSFMLGLEKSRAGRIKPVPFFKENIW